MTLKTTIDEIDSMMPQIDWDMLNREEKLAFTSMMLALELSSREKDKRKSISSSQFSVTLTMMLTLILFMFFGFGHDILLICLLSIQMLSLTYSQIMEKILVHLNSKALLSVKAMVEKFQKKYPID